MLSAVVLIVVAPPLMLVSNGTLTEGNGSVQLTSCTNSFRSAVFYIENIIYLFSKKQGTLMRRSSVQSLSLQSVFPGANVIKLFMGAVYEFSK